MASPPTHALMIAFEPVIGLEVHAQLATASKMFCACSTRFGDAPNTNICAVCMGQPGALPTVNGTAVEMGIKVGLALGCSIAPTSVFARKNYFYPDLPKGYQITQYDLPLCRDGHLTITADDGSAHTVSVSRIQLEEDTGKSTHDMGHPDRSHVDFNRCGVPLIEIISGPDLRSATEAGQYLRRLRNILMYLDVCRGNLQEGNFRCDVNVSLRPIGARELGTRNEVKNLNSFRAVERAIAYEIQRQTQLLSRGERIVQQTRLWNDASGETFPMRSKEEAHDYRYFPDPDLLPLTVHPAWCDHLRATLPELPEAKAQRFVRDWNLPEYDAAILTSDKLLADYFETCAQHCRQPKKASNWIMTEVLRELKTADAGIESCKISPQQLGDLILLIEQGTISGKIAKEVFAEMYLSGTPPQDIIAQKGLAQVSDAGELERIVDEAIAANPNQLAQYRAGKVGLQAFFVGQVMKATKGQANPQIVAELLAKKLPTP